MSNISSESLNKTTSLSVSIPQGKGKTLVKKISDLYLVSELFDFENDMNNIKKDPKFTQFSPWAFKSSQPIVTIDILLGISELSLLFNQFSVTGYNEMSIPTYYVADKILMKSPNFGYLICGGMQQKTKVTEPSPYTTKCLVSLQRDNTTCLEPKFCNRHMFEDRDIDIFSYGGHKSCNST